MTTDPSSDLDKIELESKRIDSSGEINEAATVPPPPGGLINLPTTIKKRESTRTLLAYWLLALLSAIVGVGLWGWIDGVSRERLQDLSLMFSPMVTLMATVLGFYFASRD